MDEAISTIEVIVTSKRRIAADIILIDICRTNGAEFPEWKPGAHIDMILPQGLTRQYSLCGDLKDRHSYSVAVLRAADSRGGSIYLHDELELGQAIAISYPRNHFEFSCGERQLFVAGGIGITPLLPMMAEATAKGADWHLWYGGRSKHSMAFTDALVEQYGDRVVIWPHDEKGPLPLDEVFHGSNNNTKVYCCGPEGLLDAAAELCKAWALGYFNIERFAPKKVSGDCVNRDFLVELAQTGVTLPVPADRTIMGVLQDAGIPVLNSCREGTCGTCEVTVLGGRIDHRDSILSEEEREANDTMLVCVSRALSDKLVLDL